MYDFFDDVWEILGIEPDSDVGAIRDAYSQKIKDCHPEDDPDGFMRLRGAYKTAIQLAQMDIDEDGHLQLSNFDYSYVHQAPQTQSEKSELDFSNIEREEEYLERDDEKGDKIIESLIRSSTIDKNVDEYWRWEGIVSQIEKHNLMRSLSFAKRFLNFIARKDTIRAEILEELIWPLLEKWQDHWKDTILSIAFESVYETVFSENAIAVKRAREKKLLAFRLTLFLCALVALIVFLGGLLVPTDVPRTVPQRMITVNFDFIRPEHLEHFGIVEEPPEPTISAGELHNARTRYHNRLALTILIVPAGGVNIIMTIYIKVKLKMVSKDSPQLAAREKKLSQSYFFIFCAIVWLVISIFMIRSTLSYGREYAQMREIRSSYMATPITETIRHENRGNI